MATHFKTTEQIKQMKRQGKSTRRVDCGRNIAPEEIARIAVFLNNWEPQTETEKRDKHILELAFIYDMNNSQIARLNDPLIVGTGNRSKGKPLSYAGVARVCNFYFPNLKKKTIHKQARRKERNDLWVKKKEIKRPKSCATCGNRRKIELHHIIPLAAGGTNDYFNLVYLCQSCHQLIHSTIYANLNCKIANNQ